MKEFAKSGRQITFLGAGNNKIHQNGLSYYGIENLDQLFHQLLEEAWNEKTVCKECEKTYDHNDDPSGGQCSITAALVQDIFGGELIRVSFPNGGTHFLNKINDELIDLTADQFTRKGKSSTDGKIESVQRNDCLRDMNFVMKHNLLSLNLCGAVAKELKKEHQDKLKHGELPLYEAGDDLPSFLNALEHSLIAKEAFADNQLYSTIGERQKLHNFIKNAESADFAMIKFTRLLSNQTLMTAAALTGEANARQIMLNDSIYKKSDLICEAEKQDLLQIIKEIREKL